MSFTWQAGRQMKTATNSSGVKYTFYTNDDGIRYRKSGNGVTTNYYLDGSRILAEVRSDGTKIIYKHDENGNYVGLNLNGVDYYYLFNVQGDVIGILNSSGSAVAMYHYDAWGKVAKVTNLYNSNITSATHVANVNPIRYRGYYYDVETGLYYLNSRYYDPTVGRFVNADGYVSTGQDINGFNMYAYCGNDPVCRADSGGDHWYFLWIDDLIDVLFTNKGDTEGTSHETNYSVSTKSTNTNTYSHNDVNVYISGNGSNVSDKINVELMPNHVIDDKPNPNIRIYDSYKIMGTAKQREIVNIIMRDTSFDSSVFTRTANSYITEWKIHNILYYVAFFSDYLQGRFGTADLDENENEVVAWDIAWPDC